MVVMQGGARADSHHAHDNTGCLASAHVVFQYLYEVLPLLFLLIPSSVHLDRQWHTVKMVRIHSQMHCNQGQSAGFHLYFSWQ